MIELTPVEKSHIKLTLKEKTNGWRLGWRTPLLFLGKRRNDMQYPIIIRQLDSFEGHVPVLIPQTELNPILEEFDLCVVNPYLSNVCVSEYKNTWRGKKEIRVFKQHFCFNIERVKPKKRKYKKRKA